MVLSRPPFSEALRTVAPFVLSRGLSYGSPLRWKDVRCLSLLSPALNEHTHFHVVVIDGVFEPDPEQGVRFIAAEAIDADAVRVVQTQVRRRILRADGAFVGT